VRVIGTAGHVDHGKSTLVKALTGIDPDRLKEEKERQMTIDLGFAWLSLPGGETVGVIDVPGHKDFIKNMLAGIGGIDAALFVVAADEGPMPQTREHLDILDLLQIESGVVALTKVDLVQDPDWMALVTEAVVEALDGTSLAEAPIVPVSARTGQGVPELLQRLEEALGKTHTRRDVGKPRLPVDRVFTIAGFGTVVTGTLVDGALQVGQEVELQPGGQRGRIRGLQTHNEKIETAVPGSRVAVNLSGVRVEDVARGQVLTLPGWLQPTTLLDVRLRCLKDAPAPLLHNARVEFFTGATEVMARVRVLAGDAVAPGGEAWAQLELDSPIAVVRNDRLIIRQPSPSITVGGGRIVDPHPSRRYRRNHPEVIAQLEAVAHGTLSEQLARWLDGPAPIEFAELLRKSALPKETAAPALRELLTAGEAILLGGASASADFSPPQLIMSLSTWRSLQEKTRGVVGAYHVEYPLRRGIPREELKSRLGLPARVYNELISLEVKSAVLAEENASLRLPEHQVRLTPVQQKQVDSLLAAFAASPFAPPSLADCEKLVGLEILNALVEQDRLVKVSADVVFDRATYNEMAERVVQWLRENGSITVAQVRDMFGASRKYALALMEHLDERKVTRRVGDERVLR
jgi:selenocysteine-specific elongation factor